MYQRILVPLDGSKLAECVLPHVESIARGCGVTTVVVARVAEPIEVPGRTGFVPPEIRKEAEAEYREEVEIYLHRVADRLKASLGDASVETVILTGKAAEALIHYASSSGVDLIVIATHGRSGVSRWVWGSFADRILRSAHVPVFMVRAPGCVPGV